MAHTFHDSLDVDYDDGREETAANSPTLEAKLEKAAAVTATALEQYERPAVMWTGGKDSTLVLYVVREVAADAGVPVPPVVFIDHFEHFDETEAFVREWVDRWGLDLVVARNEDFACLGASPGDEIPVSDLGASAEREGRAQDKEDLMGRLRDLGYV